MDDTEFSHRARKRIKEVKKKARPGKYKKWNITYNTYLF